MGLFIRNISLFINNVMIKVSRVFVTGKPHLFWSCVQLRQSQLELQEVQASHRQLTARLEEVTEERSLHGLTPHPSSLLCEIEQSMEQEEQEQEREQVRPALVSRCG